MQAFMMPPLRTDVSRQSPLEAVPAKALDCPRRMRYGGSDGKRALFMLVALLIAGCAQPRSGTPPGEPVFQHVPIYPVTAVHVLGHVVREGGYSWYAWQGELTLGKVIAAAGGIPNESSVAKVVVVRGKEQIEKRLEDSDFLLQDQDIVSVVKRR